MNIADIPKAGPLEIIRDYLETLPADIVVRYHELPPNVKSKSNSASSNFAGKYPDNVLRSGSSLYLGSKKAVAAAKKMHGFK